MFGFVCFLGGGYLFQFIMAVTVLESEDFNITLLVGKVQNSEHR